MATLTTRIVNQGPSVIQNATLVINFPAMNSITRPPTGGPDEFFLYPALINPPTVSATIRKQNLCVLFIALD